MSCSLLAPFIFLFCRVLYRGFSVSEIKRKGLERIRSRNNNEYINHAKIRVCVSCVWSPWRWDLTTLKLLRTRNPLCNFTILHKKKKGKLEDEQVFTVCVALNVPRRRCCSFIIDAKAVTVFFIYLFVAWCCRWGMW